MGDAATWVRWCADNGLPTWLGEAAGRALAATEAIRAQHRQRAALLTLRVLDAMRAQRLAESDLAPSHGYGYHDAGRAKLEAIFARLMGGEAALVRPQIVSGTHALAVALHSALARGDEVLLATGAPYDTLRPVFGLDAAVPGSLAAAGVTCRVIPLAADGSPDLVALAAAARPRTRAIFVQRSRGYEERPSTPLAAIRSIVDVARQVAPRAACVVDNCYGEFVEDQEPCAVGADLVAGSLIKNPGGGLASTGGYLAGRAEWVERAAARLTAPGIGAAVGPLPGALKREFLQGLLLAPGVVGQALEGAVFAAALFSALGLTVDPRPEQPRTDLIQAIRCGSRDALVAFCQGVQAASPVDAHALPEPGAMPGYEHEVIMAAGTFVQGSSSELSADGPLRPPYWAYLQGGLSLPLVVAGCLSAAARLAARGVVRATRWDAGVSV